MLCTFYKIIESLMQNNIIENISSSELKNSLILEINNMAKFQIIF